MPPEMGHAAARIVVSNQGILSAVRLGPRAIKKNILSSPPSNARTRIAPQPYLGNPKINASGDSGGEIIRGHSVTVD